MAPSEFGRLITQAKRIIDVGMPTLAKRRTGDHHIAHLLAHSSSPVLLQEAALGFLDERRTVFFEPAPPLIENRGQRLGAPFTEWIYNVTHRAYVKGADRDCGDLCVVVFVGNDHRILYLPWSKVPTIARRWGGVS